MSIEKQNEIIEKLAELSCELLNAYASEADAFLSEDTTPDEIKAATRAGEKILSANNSVKKAIFAIREV